MREERYRIVLRVDANNVDREIMLESGQRIIDILNWLEDEYDFSAKLKKVFLCRADGVEDQIY